MRILVIEDDTEAVRDLKKGLEEHGSVVDHAPDGPVGLALELTAHEPVRIRGDRHLLAQAMVNLLENAIEDVPLWVACEGNRARLVIEDDGPEMDAAFRARAFDRFTRMEQSHTTPGSGLGLCLVRAA